jgi:hypothetical protein
MFFHGGLDFTFKEIGSVGSVIDNTHHVEIDRKGLVWGAKLSSVGFESMAIKHGAGDE